MQANSIVEVDVLTSTEKKVYCLNGVGKQTKEIADIMKSSYETAKSHMKNIKAKLGLQKDKEVTAHFWCSLVGKDFDEMKRQIMASCLLVIFLLFIPLDQYQMRETRNFNNRARRTIVSRRNEYTA
jgi:DNA-binding CsgD family transcriptional regulator